MRIGQNPLKAASTVSRPAPITVAVLTHAPFLQGYWAEALDVIRICLTSLRSSGERPYDLLVFDNGSCPEVVEFLTRERSEGRIQFLILADRNLGKGGAWNVIFQASPGEIVAYTDSDARFEPGWLDRSLEVLETFPRVGMVTSRPIRTPPEFYSHTLEWASRTPEVRVEEGSLIPWDVIREFDLSLGQDEEEIRRRYDSSRDVRLTYRGVTAYAGASHYQFVARRSVLREFLPFEMERPMGQVRELDRKMNEAGYLRLTTSEPWMMNLSNSLKAVPAAGGSRSADPGRRTSGRSWLSRPSLVRRGLLALYHAIFRAVYGR